MVKNAVVVQSLVLFPDTTADRKTSWACDLAVKKGTVPLLFLSQEVWGKILGDPEPGPPQTLPPSSVCLSPRLSILSLVLFDLCRGPCSLLALRWRLTSYSSKTKLDIQHNGTLATTLSPAHKSCAHARQNV